MDTSPQKEEAQGKKVYVSLSGLPLSFHLEWPFHKSTSGADFWVLHADIALENSLGLHAPVAVNLSATVREMMSSLEPRDAEAPGSNNARRGVGVSECNADGSGRKIRIGYACSSHGSGAEARVRERLTETPHCRPQEF